MDDTWRQEIVKLLVNRITVYTEMVPEGKKVNILVEYRFPAVVSNCTDIRGELNYNVSRTIEFASARGSRG